MAQATNPATEGDVGRAVSSLPAWEWVCLWVASAAVVVASYFGWWSVGLVEAWGFATGGVCVWLVVREHLWNWPVGLANNVVFFVLFLQGRLYADMGLQVIFGLGVYGWLNWCRGGSGGAELGVARTTAVEWGALAAAAPLGTWGLMEILQRVNGAAPFWDALTTVLSLAAQYLLCRKRLENWYLWMLADVIYVPLYISRKLPLTAVLYGVLLVMCVVGWRRWSLVWRTRGGVA
jgi:nicotinamide mononucleotide transporter